MAKKQQPTQSDFRKVLGSLAYSRQIYDVFAAFCRLAACALACETREPEYLEEAKRWKREDLEKFSMALAGLVVEMQEHPFEDLLAAYYMEFAVSSSSQKWHGEFHTPKPICEMMARMTMGEIWNEKPEGTINCLEPACGAGAMILAVAEHTPPEHRRRLRFTAIDIKETVCDMCFINTTLWCVPCRIYHGNTLSMEMWKVWTNLHWICPWLPLAMNMRRDDLPKEVSEVIQGEAPATEEVKALAVALGQQEFVLV